MEQHSENHEPPINGRELKPYADLAKRLRRLELFYADAFNKLNAIEKKILHLKSNWKN